MTDAAPSRNPLHVPGVMRCARCELVITRTNLYCRDGTAGPGANETERCLNGCGPLWPMTWEQRARDADAASERLFEEARELRDALKLAYGHLWHTNLEPMAPVPMRSYEEAAVAARKVIMAALAKDERREGIDLARELLYGNDQLGADVDERYEH